MRFWKNINLLIYYRNINNLKIFTKNLFFDKITYLTQDVWFLHVKLDYE